VYAILEDGGKQYRVSQGDTIDIENRQVPTGQTTLELDQVLLLKTDQGTSVGTPTVAGAKVLVKVERLLKGRKLRMLKFRRRKNSLTHLAHRQGYLRVTIADIIPGT